MLQDVHHHPCAQERLPSWYERLLSHSTDLGGEVNICVSLQGTLYPLQFAYHSNRRSTDDAIFQVMHATLSHLDTIAGGYVRLLFIDYSSAFNTVVPSRLATKLHDLGLNPSMCAWILDFLTARPHITHIHPQHWCLPGLCAESCAVLPVHPRLCHQVQLQHHSGGPDH